MLLPRRESLSAQARYAGLLGLSASIKMKSKGGLPLGRQHEALCLWPLVALKNSVGSCRVALIGAPQPAAVLPSRNESLPSPPAWYVDRLRGDKKATGVP